MLISATERLGLGKGCPGQATAVLSSLGEACFSSREAINPVFDMRHLLRMHTGRKTPIFFFSRSLFRAKCCNKPRQIIFGRLGLAAFKG